MSENGVRIVIGANRGIGLALTEEQLRVPLVSRVIATHRQGADLQQLARLSKYHGEKLSLHELDVADSRSLAKFAGFLKQQEGGIDFTIHAAGILHEENAAPEKSFTPEQTASCILSVIGAIRPEQSGQFVNWDGSPIPW